MYRFYSKKLKRTVCMLLTGEYYATRSNEVLYTLLGSCIATCIFDEKHGVAGMNHFLLPGIVPADSIDLSEVGRYGMFAMELLIGEMIKKGATRKRLKAKLFGGGTVLNFRKKDGDIPGSNIRFARKYLKLEEIEIVAEDVGGKWGRKLLFDTSSFIVRVKKVDVREEKKLIRQEEDYKKRLFSRRDAPAFEEPIIFSPRRQLGVLNGKTAGNR